MAIVIVVMRNEADREVMFRTKSAHPRISISHSSSAGNPGDLNIYEEPAAGKSAFTSGELVGVFSMADVIGAYVYAGAPETPEEEKEEEVVESDNPV